MMSQEKIRERKASAVEIKSWCDKVRSASYDRRSELSTEFSKKKKIGEYVDVLEEELVKQFREWCNSNKDRAVIDKRYYPTFTPADFKMKEFKIKGIENVEKDLEKALNELEVETEDIIDILYSNPSREDFEIVREWCEKNKAEEVSCSQHTN